MTRQYQKMNIKHPEQPPPWLELWPDEAAINTLFSPGIRSYAAGLLQREPARELAWNENELRINLSNHVATWKLHDKAWRRTCNCGYINDCCVHTFIAARVFTALAREQQWLQQKRHAGASPSAAVPGIKQAVKATSPRPAPPTLHQLELFAAVPPAGTSNNPAAKFIEVEMDFQHDPDSVTVRFYLNLNKQRQLLRIQQVLNFGFQARRGEINPANGWTMPEDTEFLKWLQPQLRIRHDLRHNLQVLKLKLSEFAYWQEAWDDHPGRFIDRASQKPLTGSRGSARLRIELTQKEDDWIEIAAIITGTNGRDLAYHEIFKMLASGQKNIVAEGEILDFQPPLSWNLLNEVFAKKQPRIRRKYICEHLANLLEGRLDLVCGPAVSRRQQNGTVTIAAISDGADVLLRAEINGAPIMPDSDTAAGSIQAAGDRFMITDYTSPELNMLRKTLRKLPLTPVPGANRLKLAGTAANMKALRQAWLALPPAITRLDPPPSLQGLLTESPAAPCPELSIAGKETFIDLHLAWEAAGQRFTSGELRDAMHSGQTVIRSRTDGGWLSLDEAALAETMARVQESGFDVNAGMRLFKHEAARCLRQFRNSIPATKLTTMAERLAAMPPPTPPALPAALSGILRPYQQKGFEFLADRCACGVGPILADDMGLGKTLQTLSLLKALLPADPPATTSDKRGAFVVCPASVASVWAAEAARFCPDLICTGYSGTADKRADIIQNGGWHILICTYALARNDIALLTAYEFAMVILDEAQYIKNPDSQVAMAVKKLRTPQPLALTGTPLENRLLDLWSIMDFLNPGFLGAKDAFLAQGDGTAVRARLAERIAPVLLRRTKTAVAPELPPRTEETLLVELPEPQRLLYDREVLAARAAVQEKGPIEILAALTRLRQLCCHPELLFKEKSIVGSAKLDTLIELLDELTAEGHSALVFSQFTSMLALIEERLDMQNLPYLKITGSTPVVKRAEIVREFNETETPMTFLLSLKAAGTGLTLTKADYVFLFDPWWNPAVERQAIDRTHRIGQDKPVIAYRLVAKDTVEEKVLKLQQEKAELFAAVIDDGDGSTVPARLTAADLAELIE